MRIHPILFICFLVLGSCELHAQQDYLILHQGDTLHGTYIPRNSIHKFVLLRTETGKVKIPSKDVKAYFWKNNTYMVYEDPCEGGLSAYKVLIAGNATLLHSGGFEDYCPELVLINKELYPIERKHYFSPELWKIMSTCPAFKEKYENYYNEHREKTIIWEWVYRKSRMVCLEMILYYNAHCGKATP